jgi:DNA polymerase elongation subunit (family B)
MQELWSYKAPHALRRSGEELSEEEVSEAYNEKAGIYAEFGKIVCISVGIVVRDKNNHLSVRLKSFASDDEKKVLTDFAELLNQYYQDPARQYICGHNIKEFDIPYICRRMVIHQVTHPAMLQLHGKKPWETKHLLDTLELWKFGDFKNYTSLKLLAGVLGFPSPKDDIDGSEVGRVYWEEEDLERIAVYCEKDVLATVQLLLKFMYMPLLTDDQVTFVDRRETTET